MVVRMQGLFLLSPQLLMLLLLLLPALLGAVPANINSDAEQRSSSCAVSQRPSVYDAINELFSCLVQTHIEPTEIYRKASGIDFHGIAGNGVTQAPLLTGIFSVSGLKTTSATESYRRYYDVSSIFTVELGREEARGPAELAKLNDYLNYLEQSPFVRDTFATLRDNGALNGTTLNQFVRGNMYNQWFKTYGRTLKAHNQGLRESSGFGHVFVGEVKTNEVTGFHSWLQLLSSEEAGTFDYKGYVKVIRSSVLIGGIQFSWMGRPKPLSSLMFGVPPEFEIALYSACFVVNPGRKTNLSLRGKAVSVQTLYVNHQTESVATAYPVV